MAQVRPIAYLGSKGLSKEAEPFAYPRKYQRPEGYLSLLLHGSSFTYLLALANAPNSTIKGLCLVEASIPSSLFLVHQFPHQ